MAKCARCGSPAIEKGCSINCKTLTRKQLQRILELNRYILELKRPSYDDSYVIYKKGHSYGGGIH